jgi:hypothetical protein
MKKKILDGVIPTAECVNNTVLWSMAPGSLL